MLSPLSPLSPRSPAREEKKFNWSRPKLISANSGTGHKVSFSGSSKSTKSSNERGLSHPSQPSDSSRSSSPQTTPSATTWPPASDRFQARNWQRIDRQSEALWQETIPLPIESQPRPFLIYHDSFLSLIGPAPTLKILIDDSRAPYFHEAGVFHPKSNTLFITSNLLPDPAPDAVTTANKTIVITRLEFFTPTDFSRDKVRCPERNYMANGGTNYRDGLILCAQGSLNEPAGLIYMEAKRPHRTCSLLNNYHARPFNSPNDVVVHSDGSVWFTDPIYGFEQGFRPKPQLPQHVYRFVPATGDVRAVADGFGRPNGIAFAPDEQTLYVTDTDAVHASTAAGPAWDPTRAATIYAFSLLRDPATQAPFLVNRRVFAHADAGIPDGIKCDVHGNVYAGCGDGINVWNSGGMLIGKILIEGGVANFCFGRKGELWAFGEKKLWRVQLAEGTMGALLKI
ncbi:hypothetical protein MMC15_000094 [Xylographa vitiligo]|nr:hypothetical protein [Xylographa vitiligo]